MVDGKMSAEKLRTCSLNLFFKFSEITLKIGCDVQRREGKSGA